MNQEVVNLAKIIVSSSAFEDLLDELDARSVFPTLVQAPAEFQSLIQLGHLQRRAELKILLKSIASSVERQKAEEERIAKQQKESAFFNPGALRFNETNRRP